MAIGGIQNGLTAKASAFAYFDARDLNRDGVVSPSELATYALRHPELKASKRQDQTQKTTQNPWAAGNNSMPQYNKQGALGSGSKATSRLFDEYA